MQSVSASWPRCLWARRLDLFFSKLIAVTGSASTVNYAVSLCVLASILMGSSFRVERKLEVGLRVYAKAGDVVSGA